VIFFLESQDVDLFRSVLYLTTYGSIGGTDELNDKLTEREKTAYGTILENGTKVCYRNRDYLKSKIFQISVAKVNA
jgi:hypothetical protein